MAHFDEERTIRTMLAEMTADQPPAPPARYAAVRRRAIAHRRRQLAGAAAALAVLVAVAIAIPLNLLHIGPTPPATPSTHYHISQSGPGPGSPHGLVATGTAKGRPWRLSMQRTDGMVCEVEQFPPSSGTAKGCTSGPPAAASRSGDPVSMTGADGSPWQVDYGTVRSDVSYLTISYNNGQVVPVYPVAVFSAKYARYFAFAVPYPAAVTQITAYGRSGELAYAIPFTSAVAGIQTVRWIQPGQPAGPSPVAAQIGFGRIDGKKWHAFVHIGPWGTCFTGVGGATACSPRIAWPHGRQAEVDQIASSGSGYAFRVVFGETSPAVSYLELMLSNGHTVRWPTVSVGGRKFFAYASADRDRVSRWAAYNAAGLQLASGRPMG